MEHEVSGAGSSVQEPPNPSPSPLPTHPAPHSAPAPQSSAGTPAVRGRPSPTRSPAHTLTTPGTLATATPPPAGYVSIAKVLELIARIEELSSTCHEYSQPNLLRVLTKAIRDIFEHE